MAECSFCRGFYCNRKWAVNSWLSEKCPSGLFRKDLFMALIEGNEITIHVNGWVYSNLSSRSIISFVGHKEIPLDVSDG